jgi:hypothetical protein
MSFSPAPVARASAEAARLRSVIRQTSGVPFYASAGWQEAFADRSANLSDLPRITKSRLREHSPEGFLREGLTVESLVARGLV